MQAKRLLNSRYAINYAIVIFTEMELKYILIRNNKNNQNKANIYKNLFLFHLILIIHNHLLQRI